MSRTRARALMVGVMTLAAVAPSGCISKWLGAGEPVVAEEGTFLGPPMGLGVSGEVHAVTMRAPNPGWDVAFDRAEKTAGPTRLLMTVTRPDPTLIFAQRIVDKTVTTTVPTSEGVEVFARITDHGVRKSDEPYRRVLLGTGPE